MALIMTQKLKFRLLTPNIFCIKMRLFYAFFIMLVSSTMLSAQILGLHNSDDQKNTGRTRFIEAARAYLGVPYIRGGTTSEGMDCSGLVYRSAVDSLGEQVPRTVVALSARTERITDQAREPGDLLFFNTTGRISHVGIYLGGGIFIHSASDGPNTGVIISDLSEDYWKRTYRYAGRLLKSEGIKIPDEPEQRAPAINPFPFGGEIGLRLNFTGGILWDFMPNEFPGRGTMFSAEAVWMKGMTVYPGIETGIDWDARSSSFSIPLIASITTEQGFRFFIGTQIHLLADKALSRKPQIPGLLGISWSSKPAILLGQKVRFYQSAEYSYFPNETFSNGFRFNTGLTFSYDI